MEQLTPEEMDANAEQAKQELMEATENHDVDVFEVASWWKTWFMKCGHKRLGRALLKFAQSKD